MKYAKLYKIVSKCNEYGFILDFGLPNRDFSLLNVVLPLIFPLYCFRLPLSHFVGIMLGFLFAISIFALKK